MASLVTVKREVEKIKRKVAPKDKTFIKVWVADCLVIDRNRVIDTKIDEKGRKWAAIRVECRE